MADWDDEDFEPPSVDKPSIATDQWEGEDEEDDIKDNWDDEDEESKPDPPAEVAAAAGEPKKGKKKALAKKLKEKEEAAAKAAEAKRLAAIEAAKTPDEKLADKLLAQKLAQESDLEVAKDTFGVSAIDPNKVIIDNFDPRTKEDFITLEKMVSEKFSTFESSPHYQFFLETLFRSSCLCLDAESLKKITSSLNVLQNEKAKQERQKKGGKKTTKAKLAGGTKAGARDDIADYSVYDDMDDFM